MYKEMNNYLRYKLLPLFWSIFFFTLKKVKNITSLYTELFRVKFPHVFLCYSPQLGILFTFSKSSLLKINVMLERVSISTDLTWILEGELAVQDSTCLYPCLETLMTHYIF